MTGVLDGIDVLDLSEGIAGPITAMLLADHGARVTKVERPGGDPSRALSGATIWHRGKRSAELDLNDASDRSRLVALAGTVDVLIETFRPGRTTAWGIDFATLQHVNPKLVYCSITGYGDEGRHADRPAIDALVAARTGHQWESRGVAGGTLARLAGVPGVYPELETPADCWVGAPRPGPLFSGVPWVSLAAAYQATLAVSAALRARTMTGRGQRVATSLLQGVLGTTQFAWQRVEHPDAPNFQSWIIDPRAPKGMFRCVDGRWVHQWVPLPEFILPPSTGDRLVRTPDTKNPRGASNRIGTEASELVLLQHYQPEMAAAVARFPSTDWERLAAEVGIPLQPVRSPEEALRDPALLADGCVIEVTHPDLGPLRQVGRVYELHACPTATPTPPVRIGADNDAVRADADAARHTPSRTGLPPRATLKSPLEGIRVLDLGLAVAGPWGTMMLADLGADVIKVNTLHDGYWMGSHIAMCCNRGKRSIAMDLKRPEAMSALYRLVASADIVQHNMRYDAARRLGVDYESLRSIKPDLIYCHTRGFERGDRERLPGNDQTGAALAGPDWLDGGLDHDGIPYWPAVSLGDTGNGFLSAIAMVQALYHRDRTGEGQFVDTSIMYAHLLNASLAWDTREGLDVLPRPSLDRMQLGWSPWYRLYETSSGWLCVAAVDAQQRAALVSLLGLAIKDEPEFDLFEVIFATNSAQYWRDALEGAGVPAEIVDPDFVLSLFDDPEMIEKGWVATYEHPIVGRMDALGLLFDLSDTPGVVQGPPFVPGQHSRGILAEAGFTDAEIAALLELGAVAEPTA